MTIQKATVKATLGSLVQVRNVFTCNVVPAGGDTSEILWTAYLDSIYVKVKNLTSPFFATYSYEIAEYSGGSWVPSDEVTFTHTGLAPATYLPNAVSLVLLGKASGLRHVGRKFFSGIAVANQLGNAITTDAMINAAGALLAYITPFTGIGGGEITPGVVDAAGGFHPFVGGVVSSLLGSMRRRKPGIGI